MAAIQWDQVGSRAFEAGVDRGVLYFPEGGGVAWNGLTEISERSTNTAEPVYFDGIKYTDIVVVGDYSATMKAYTYPDEFLEFEGISEDQTGVYIADQMPQLFHLSYRTRVGSDVDSSNEAYKIHLLWNLIAIPSTKTYQTLSLDVDPTEFEWSLSAVPEDIEGHRPSSHMILDSRKLDSALLADIEAILYGDIEHEPTLPNLKALSSYIRKWDRLVVNDNGDGTWSASTTVPGVIEEVDINKVSITSDTIVLLSGNKFTITSSEKNEEDIY